MAERTDMKDFAARLEEEAEKKVEKIEAGDLNMIKKSFEASLVLADAFLQLKAFIADYTFRDEAEEIEFFKTVKPRICHRLIYYRKIYNIEMNRPVGNESQRSYQRETFGLRALLPLRADPLGRTLLPAG